MTTNLLPFLERSTFVSYTSSCMTAGDKHRSKDMLRLTVDLEMSFECGASSWIFSFTLVRSWVLQLNVGNLQHSLWLSKSRFLGDVAIYLPPCDCRHWALRREEWYYTLKYSLGELSADYSIFYYVSCILSLCNKNIATYTHRLIHHPQWPFSNNLRTLLC